MENTELQAAIEAAAQKRRRQILVIAAVAVIAFAIGFVSGLGVARKVNPCVVVPTISVERDTVLRIDTVKGKIIPPTIRTIIKRDTLVLPAKPDTSYKVGDTLKSGAIRSPLPYELPDGRLVVPIEQRTYATSLYKAVVSGWQPSLDSIEVYPTTRTITETITKLAQPPRKWLTLAAGPSITYTTDKRVVAGASVLLGINIKSW